MAACRRLRRPQRSALALLPPLVRPALLLPLLLSCGRGPGASDEARDRAVAGVFVNRVALPGYRQLAQRSGALAASLDQLAAHPDADRLLNAREAWAAARRSWETSESWAFGPAQTQGFDANLDDWPVNEKDLGSALATSPLSAALFARLTSTARGFHGIEAVLFGISSPPPTAQQLGAGQLGYLQLAGRELARQAQGLLQAWQGTSGFGSSFAASSLKTSSPDASSPATNGSEAIAEILQGMLGTLQEVSAEKLGKPLASRRRADLESFYSGTSQADVAANLAGIQEVWQRSGLQQLITNKDRAAGRALTQELAVAIERVGQLPRRLDASLSDADGRRRIAAAIEAIDRCAGTLEQISGRWS